MNPKLGLVCINCFTAVLCACGGGSSSSEQPVNVAPTISTLATVSVLEGQILNAQIDAADQNANQITLSLDLNSVDSRLFSLDNKGRLTFTNHPDFEAPEDLDNDNVYQVTVVASDGSLSTAATVSVLVTDAFEARVVDGPIAGARFFIDLNDNNIEDSGEPSGITDDEGFILIPQISLADAVNPKVITRGGRDTSTGQELRNLVLVGPISADLRNFVFVTPLSTIGFSSADTPQIFAALGVTETGAAIFGNDLWAAAENQEARALEIQRLNAQLGIILLSLERLFPQVDGVVPNLLAVNRQLTLEVLAHSSTSGILRLTDSALLSSIFTNFEQVHNTGISNDALSTVAQTVASINILLASSALDPTSVNADTILELFQTRVLNAINSLISNNISPTDFMAETTVEMIFAGAPVPDSTLDTDADGLHDVFDTDTDNDNVLNNNDAFPLDTSEYVDSDFDGIGNNADPDDDNDGVNDVDDAFPLDAAETLDTDGDGTGNNADPDDDNDGVNDVDDAFPLNAAETLDNDADGTGDNADLDDDNDGVNDVDDAFPLDATETLDTDGDGTGNNADLDDDNDGVVDADDERPLDPNTYELPVALPQSVNVDLASGVQTSITGNLTATSQQSRSVTYALVTAASLGTVTLNDASTGAYTYQTLANTTEAGTDSFSFRVNDGFIDSLTTTISISINSDPLYPLQWHLNNSGQATFSDTGGSLGEDLNVDTVTNAGTLGLGTIVAVVDEGMEIAHPDLIENVVADGSYDYVEADNDPTNPGIIGDHGTSVAGIIAARGWNNIGVRGVAPAASLKGFNFLRNQSLSNEIDALGGASNAPSGDVDIFNLSFGVNTTTAFRLNSSLEAQLLDGVTNLRSGNGAIYIKSSGNGFNGFVFNGTTVTCPNAANLGLSCQNTSQDPMHIVPYIIGAAALNAGGTASSYSTVGATNWVSAPGGEFGQNAQFLGSGNGRPAIMTTDQSGCSRGYVRSANTNPTPNPRNAFEDGGNHALNAMCSYTSTFNGTSSAAPNIAGVVALMLSVNADLNWRDVKHILATTSRQIDADRPAIVATGIELEPAWTTNDAGLTFHNVYGFGAIDASAAVVAAEVYVADSLGTFDQGTIRNNNLSRMVADGETITSILNEPDQGIIEFVRVEIFATHAFPGDWTIALISPSGTRSVLLPALNAYTTWPASGFELGSNAFYGESKQGDWTLEVTDHVTDDVGTLTSWSIRIYGH